MTFAHPQVLWIACGILPALGLFFAWAARERRRRIARFVPSRLQENLTLGVSPRRRRLRTLLMLAGIACLLLALARPRYGAGTVEVRQRGLDILIGVDTSRSMLAEDAGPAVSRLRRAKLAALDLARLARSDRIGLIAFAGSAFLQCPLTVDTAAFRQSLDTLDTEIIPRGGTALGSAIHEALNAFKNEQENVRVLVLFTDGEEHESSAVDAAKEASGKGLRIFTVGVGTTRGEIIRVHDAEGRQGYLKDAEGNVVKSALNEGLLQEIARTSGGFYLPLQGARAMEELFHRGLEPLPRVDLASRQIEEYEERYQWPLALALVLLGLEAVLPERSRSPGRVRPMRLLHPTLAGSVAPLVLGVLAMLACVPPAMASPGSALRAYRKGSFENAEREYERLATQHPEDARLHFNAGTSAYRSEAYPKAIDQLTQTLRTPDLKLQHDAFYNLGNAQFSQGDTLQDAAARQALWEQSLQSFEAALKLQSTDVNARHNLEYVRRRLEELKKQQEEKQKRNQEQQKKDQQDQKESKDPSSQSSSKDKSKDQSQSGQKPNKDQQQPSPENQEPKKSEDQQEKRPSQSQQSQQPKPSEEQKQANASKAPKEDGTNAPADSAGGQNGGQVPPGQMTPQQALRLLDAAKGDEKPIPLEKRQARGRVLKDW